MDSKYLRAVNFDLSTANLKKYYPGAHYRAAYRDVKKFMLSHRFKHRQWSGYVSIKEMSDPQVVRTVKNLNKAFPWLKKCVNRFDVTNIGETYDMLKVLNGKTKQAQKTAAKVQTKPQKQKRGNAVLNRKQFLKNAQIIANKQQTNTHDKNRGQER